MMMNEPANPSQAPTPATPRPQRPTALYRSARFLGHDTGAHVENPGRIAAIDAELERTGLLGNRPEPEFGPASREQLEAVHAPAYLDAIERAAARGGGWIDGDTVLLPDSVEVARLAAGATVAATSAVLDGEVSRAFVLARPPGHHATPERGMGFCLLNSVAIAATYALARGLERVLILDWDVHHGNGTQDAFYETNQVLFCSLHQSPLYPGTGDVSERGSGAGAGFTLNLPLPPGLTDEDYQHAFTEAILPAAREYAPELVLVSAGYDAHRLDPLAGMRLTEAGFAWMTNAALELAAACANGRLVAVLEGGYEPEALGRSVAATLETLDRAQ